MSTNDMPMTKIIPNEGIMSVAELAEVIGIPNMVLMQGLTDNGIKVVRFGKRYTQRFVSLRAFHNALMGYEL